MFAVRHIFFFVQKVLTRRKRVLGEGCMLSLRRLGLIDTSPLDASLVLSYVQVSLCKEPCPTKACKTYERI